MFELHLLLQHINMIIWKTHYKNVSILRKEKDKNAFLQQQNKMM